MKWTRATQDDVFGTGLRGTFKASYAQVVEVLGEPHHVGSGDGKIQVKWMLKFEDGTIATVYDYKSDEPSYAVEDWHVGGGGSRRTGGSALQRVLELIGPAMKHCYHCRVALKGDTCPDCGRIAVAYRDGATYDMVSPEDLALALSDGLEKGK